MVHVRMNTGEKKKEKYQSGYTVSFLKVIYLLISCSHKEAKIYGYPVVSVVKQQAPDLSDDAGQGMAHCGCRGTGGPQVLDSEV